MRRRVRAHRGLVIAATVAVVAIGMAWVSTPVARAIECDDTTSDRVIRLDDADVGVPTTIGVRDNALLVNGVDCGAATSVAVVDVPSVETADDIIIDLTEPMRIDGLPVIVTLVLDPDELSGARDRVRILGSHEVDRAVLFPDNLIITATGDFPAGDDTRLSLVFESADIDLTVDLGDGRDTFEVRSSGGVFFENDLVVRGGAGDDVIEGGPNSDVLRGGDGRDLLVGKGGADDIRGGLGDDTIRGGKGADDLRGQSGDDTVLGQSGRDTIRGGSGADIIRGGTAGDTILGGKGPDVVYGNSGGDTIRGGGRGDFINGGKGRDQVFGNAGNDEFEMDDGVRDTVSGGSGNRDTCNRCDDRDVVRRSVEIRLD